MTKPKKKPAQPAAVRKSRTPAEPSKRDPTRDAHIVASFGATGTGKTTYLLEYLMKAPAPHLIFDPKHSLTGGVFLDERKWHESAGHVPRAVFYPSFDQKLRIEQFGRFCDTAVRIMHALGRVSVLVDELHLLSPPGRAPAKWQELLETGRERHASVFAAAIRPAECDKVIRNNATVIRAGRLSDVDDCKAVANSLGVDWREVLNLRGGDGVIEFLEKNRLNGDLKRGRIIF